MLVTSCRSETNANGTVPRWEGILKKIYVYDKIGAIPTIFSGTQGPRAHERSPGGSS